MPDDDLANRLKRTRKAVARTLHDQKRYLEHWYRVAIRMLDHDERAKSFEIASLYQPFVLEMFFGVFQAEWNVYCIQLELLDGLLLISRDQGMIHLPRFRFGLRALMSLMVVSALAMFGWLQHCKYYRTHVFIQVVDQVSGKGLSRFEYRFRIITSESEPDNWYSNNLSDVSDWTNYHGDGPLVLAIPEYCRLALNVRSLDLDGGYEATHNEELFLPELSHTWMVRMRQGMEVEGIVFDAEKKTPIQNATISSGDFQDVFAVRTDSEGRFHLRNVRSGEDILAVHGEYQIGVVSTNLFKGRETSSIALTRARRIEGRVCCSASGEPIDGCSISQQWIPKRNGIGYCGCFGSFPIFRERQVTTDQMGQFVFYFDHTADSTLVVGKQGWSDKRIELKKGTPNLDPILLDLAPCLLRGSVVNGRGDPETEFDLQVEVNDYRFYRGKEMLHVADANGRFEFRSQMALDAFSIRSNSNGVFYYRGSPSNEEGIQEDLLDLQIKLADGFCLKGYVVGDPKTKTLTEMRLLRGYTDPDADLLLPIPDEQSVWRARVSERGGFRIEPLTVGEYTLVTLCNGYLVNKRPVTIRDQDVSVENIVLPPLLNVAGTVELPDGAPSRINSFELECDRYSRLFRSDFRGAFTLTNIPAGNYTIRTIESEYIDVDAQPVAEVTFSKNSDYRLSFREIPLIQIESGTFPHFEKLRIDYTQGVYPTHRTLKQAEEDPRLLLGAEVSGNIDARLTFDTRGSDHQVYVPVDVDSRNGPTQIYLRPRELIINYADDSVGMQKVIDSQRRTNFLKIIQKFERDPFVDGEDLVVATAKAGLSKLSNQWSNGDHRTKIFFIRDGELIAKVTTDESLETLGVVLPDRNPDTCIIQNPRLGWAKIVAPVISSDQITLSDVRFSSGVNVNIRFSLDGLSVFPTELRLSHSEGAVISIDIKSYQTKQSFDFPHTYPGRWAAEIVGTDPFLGELVLARSEFLVGNSDSVAIKLGSSD